MKNRVIITRITNLYGLQPSSVVLYIQNCALGPILHVSMGPRHHLCFHACKTACLASELLVSVGPSSHLWFLHANSDFWTRITSLYGSQISPVVMCMQYSVISTRLSSLYVSLPSSVVFACKTTTFGPELQVSMGPIHHLSFCACNTA